MANVGVWNRSQEGNFNVQGPDPRWGDPFGGYSCLLDGFETPCSQVMYVLSIGIAEPVWNHEQPIFLGHWATERDWSTEQLYDYFVPAFNLYQTQQLPEPKLPNGANYSQGQLEALRNAFREALSRLQNQDCAKLFTNWWDNIMNGLKDEKAMEHFFNTFTRNPSDVLKNIEFRILPLRPPVIQRDANGNITSVSVTGAQTNSRNSVFINSSNGVFFNRTQTIEGETKTFNLAGTASLTQTQFAALLLLHELGHAYGEANGLFNLFGPDAQSPRNAEHSQKIINACFPELRQNNP